MGKQRPGYGRSVTMNLRYTFGGDEFLFVEISEAMSLPAFFTGMSITEPNK